MNKDFTMIENLELLKIEDKEDYLKVRDDLSIVEAIEKEIIYFQEKVENLEKLLIENKNNLLENMKKYDVKTLSTQSFTITRIDESTRNTFDSKKFKEEHKDLYDNYLKQTTVKASLRITLKKRKEIE